ncbi:MAG: pentapeptide repeat-containing protein [Planctomycetes bacterium]|nr:pentapeptide repeat-containing protein [Planctomycetota bacterium]
MLEALATGGFVRPRYDDGTLEEPLPLLDLVLERVLHPGRRGRLVVQGPRGSGLTTTARWLAQQVAAGGHARVFGPGRIDAPGLQACLALDRGEAVLLLDLSPGRLDPDAWENARRLLADASARRWRAVAALPSSVVLAGPAPSVRLAPWTWDDVVELLAAPRYGGRRGQLLAALRALPGAAGLIARPRTAAWLVDAALALDPEEPVTLGRLYANVLDGLGPATLDLLRRHPPGAWTATSLADALEALRGQALDAEEVSALFELTPALAEVLHSGELGRAAVVRAHAGWASAERPAARLALPGLHDLLQAGDCLARVARDDPPRTIAPAWFPFLRELMTEPLRARLRAWLTDPALEGTGDAQAATLLWATGETPPLDATRRRLALYGAWLEGVDLPGADLGGVYLARTRLAGARLAGARLPGACLVDVDLDGAALDGADLSRVVLKRSSLVGATLQGVRAGLVTLGECDLRRAALDGADLSGAAIDACRLEGASLRRATLRRAEVVDAALAGADLDSVDLAFAALTDLDLGRVLALRPVSLADARLTRCLLVGLDLSDVEALRARWLWCDLTDLSLAGASLVDARFERCHAHGARFDGADLRGSLFDQVSFQAGSSRAGLLVGKPALEGSMTGYYAEGTTDEAWTPPEALRQASFVDADLRGARFRSTNLFRVDLRGARLEPGLREQAREQGALLDP